MSLRHAAAYAVFDKEEDVVKAARNSPEMHTERSIIKVTELDMILVLIDKTHP